MRKWLRVLSRQTLKRMQGRMCGLGREGDTGEGVRGKGGGRGKVVEGEREREGEGEREGERGKGRKGEGVREGEGWGKEDQMMIHRAARIHQSVSAITLYLAHLRKYES